MFDILIVGISYPDYQKKQLVYANIGIKEGKIEYIGQAEPTAKKVILAEGKILSPGFIDIHTHEEDFKLENDYCIGQKMLEMGVTTILGGNCGKISQSFSDVKDFIASRGGSPVYYAMSSGYNTYRARYVGNDEPPSKIARSKIEQEIIRDLNEGAFGLSFGIEYQPNMTTEEILFACSLLENSNLIASAHYRKDGDKCIESIEEMFYISKNIDAKFQISHLSSCSACGYMKESLDMIEKEMKINSKLNYDTYPYDAFSTRIGSAVYDGDFTSWLKIDYSDVMLTEEPYKNQRCTKELFYKARKENPNFRTICFAMDPQEISLAISDKNGMYASDGGLTKGNGHPRAVHTFPRILGKYVREEKVISLIDALLKMTKIPADRLGLKFKGEIKIGNDADLVIFDKDKIGAKEEWSDFSMPEGINYVIVNGKIAMDNKRIVNNRLGGFVEFNKKL